jgi:AcrR family transcriptional regulator
VRQPGQNGKDRRVQRTQRLLQDGLRALLGQKSMEEIAVLDITEAANVNRATFYDHYADKLDLFNALIAAEFQQLLERRNICFDGSCGSGLAAIVLAVGDYLAQIHGDKPACTRHATSGPLIDSAITLAIRRILLDGLENRAMSVAVPREVFASMLSGTIYAAVKEWLSSRQWKMEEEALLLLVPLIQPLLVHSHTGSGPS